MAANFKDLSERSIDIFRELIEAFFATGEPVGSRTISRRPNINLSPATVRNVMSDLEEAGLLFSPHTSAGRLPTDMGIQYFVDALLTVKELDADDKAILEERCFQSKKNIHDVLEDLSTLLSSLSHCVSVVGAPKSESKLKHIEFVPVNANSILVVLVTTEGVVENRLIDLPDSVPLSALQAASNYLNSHLSGHNLQDVQTIVHDEMNNHRAALDELSSKLVEQGLAVWGGTSNTSNALIVKGQANLLHDINELQDLEVVRQLFNILETKEHLSQLLDASIKGQGVQIFIGAENKLFHLTGCSMILAPYRNSEEKIIGALGVIGSNRMNYHRIIPLVDYTSRMISRLLSGQHEGAKKK